MTDMYLILIVSWKTIKKMHLLALQKYVVCCSPGVHGNPLWEKCVHMRTLLEVVCNHISYFSKCLIPKQGLAVIYEKDLGEEHCYQFRWPSYLSNCARFICQDKTKISFSVYVCVHSYGKLAD